MRRFQVQVLLVALIALATPFAAGAAEVENAVPPCEPISVDLTSPEVTEWLASLPQTVQFSAIGRPEVRQSGGTKISKQSFTIVGEDGDLAEVEISCTGTCTGSGCGVSGCDIVAAGCSGCTCPGCSAQCSCSKKTVIETPN